MTPKKQPYERDDSVHAPLIASTGVCDDGIPEVASSSTLDSWPRAGSHESGLDTIQVSERPNDEAAILLPPSEGKQEHNDRVAVGMLWYAASSFFFSAMGICSKQLGNLGYPVWEITFFRAILILCCSLGVLLRAGDHPLGNRRFMLLMRGTLGYGSITCYFFACQLLPLADAVVFTFLAPLFVALSSPLLLNERPSFATLIVIPLNIVGVLFIVQPDALFGAQSAKLSILGLVFGLGQPFFSATAKYQKYVGSAVSGLAVGVQVVRKIVTYGHITFCKQSQRVCCCVFGNCEMTVRALRTTEKTNVMIFYLMMCTLAYSVVGCVMDRDNLILPNTWTEAALLLGQGLAGYGNQVCITNGLRNAKAAPVMSMQYLSIVVSQAAGMVLFGEFTSPLGAFGMALIVGSMLVFMWWESRSK